MERKNLQTHLADFLDKNNPTDIESGSRHEFMPEVKLFLGRVNDITDEATLIKIVQGVFGAMFNGADITVDSDTLKLFVKEFIKRRNDIDYREILLNQITNLLTGLWDYKTFAREYNGYDFKPPTNFAARVQT
jgi:hypothetical protein